MYEITVGIPDTFLEPLDELVMQMQAPSREELVKAMVRNAIFDYQMRKDFAQQQQKRGMQLIQMWP